MNFTCENCHTKLTIDDNKIPKGKKTSFLCPKCRKKIVITSEIARTGIANSPIGSLKDRKKHLDSGREAAQDLLNKEVTGFNDTSDYDIADRPFVFLEDNAKTVLICMKDDELRGTIEKAFAEMDYHIIVVSRAATALTSMKYHIFNCIFLSEDFDPDNKGGALLLYHIKKLNMEIRRKIFVVIFSRRYHTADNMAAFHASVNLIINIKDLKNMKKIFIHNFREYEKFYSVFNDSIKKIGKL